MATLREKLTQTDEGRRLYEQERAILEVTELICEIMDANGVTRTKLAELMGTTKGYVSQLLDGDTNMTVKTMSDVFFALERQIHFRQSLLNDCRRESTPDVTMLFDAPIWQNVVKFPSDTSMHAVDSHQADALAG